MRKIAIFITLIMVFSASCFAEEATTEVGTGDYFLFGKYQNEAILWRCADIDDNGVLLISDEILCYKAFDAPGSVLTGSHGRGTGRTNNGSNYWADSNIRAWLNSNAAAGNVIWPCGNAPSIENFGNSERAYNNEKGFLNEFTAYEISLIKNVTQKSILDQNEYEDMTSYGQAAHIKNASIENVVQNYDTAYGEQVTDKIFLPDVKQIHEMNVNLPNYYKITSGSTAERCYWLRTARATLNNSTNVRYIDATGSVQWRTAEDAIGIRPAFYISESAVINTGDGTKENPFTLIAPYILACKNLPVYTGTNSSGFAVAVIRNSQGVILTVDMMNIQLSSTATTPVTFIVENTDFTDGDLLDIYAWDGNMKPVINAEHYEFSVEDGEIALVSAS